MHTKLPALRQRALEAYRESPLTHDRGLAARLERIKRIEQRALKQWSRRIAKPLDLSTAWATLRTGPHLVVNRWAICDGAQCYERVADEFLYYEAGCSCKLLGTRRLQERAEADLRALLEGNKHREWEWL